MLSILFHLICSKSQYKLILYLEHFCRNWLILSGGAHNRKPNGILGALCREHFPGLMEHAGVRVADADDREGRNFGTKARRVVGELWVSNRGTTLVNISDAL